jgi:pimeloyl-ACP methyl ester carboxylesterase
MAARPKRDSEHEKLSKNVLCHMRSSDLRAVAKLAGAATVSVQKITEETHQAVLSTLGQRGGTKPDQTGGLTGLIYKGLRGATTLITQGIDKALEISQPLIDLLDGDKADTPERDMMLAVLNGVLGDHLAETSNPLAISMSLRHGSGASSLALDAPISQTRGKLVFLLHGLCVNERIWQSDTVTADMPKTSDLGALLATQLGYQPLYLRYNTGLHISQNGRELALKIEALLEAWPVAIEEISLIGYSMGGLVARSAVHIASIEGMQWPAKLKNMVFLATPHHGSPLEKAGNWFETALGSIPYSAPFARLAKMRSAGITDLRYGYLCDEDWRGNDRFRRQLDNRAPVPLPENVKCFVVAATTASKRSRMTEQLTGDGLVPLNSALGLHDNPAYALKFSKDAEMIAFRLGHMAVPTNPVVLRQILTWLGRD